MPLRNLKGEGPTARGEPNASESTARKLEVALAELGEARVSLARMDELEENRKSLLRELEELRAVKMRANQSDIQTNAIAVEAELAARAASKTVSFRLGSAILDAGRTRSGLLKLPKTLSDLRKEVVEQRKKKSTIDALDASKVWYIEQLLQRAGSGSVDEALAWLSIQDLTPERRGEIIIQVARDVLNRSPEAAVKLTLDALSHWPSVARARWVAFALFDSGFVSYPNQILQLADMRNATSGEVRRIDHIKSLGDRGRSLTIPRRSAVAPDPNEKTVLLLANQSLPHHLTSQTLRNHVTSLHMARASWRTVIVTEPGYPAGRDAVAVIAEQKRGAQDFIRLPATEHLMGDYSVIAAETARQFVTVIEEVRPRMVVSAGNMITSEAGLYAARRCGLDFVLDLSEIRPPWMMPHRQEKSGERAEILLRRTAATAASSDRVIVRTKTMADVLEARSVPRESIHIVPDPIVWPERADAANSLREELELHGATVVGTIGQIGPARGFLQLLSTLAKSREKAGNLAVLLCGPVQQGDRLKEHFAQNWPNGRLSLPGRIQPEDYATYASLIDVWLEPPPLTEYGALTTSLQFELARHLNCRILAPDLPIFRERLGSRPLSAFYAPNSAEGFGAVFHDLLSTSPATSGTPAWDPSAWAKLYRAALTGISPA